MTATVRDRARGAVTVRVSAVIVAAFAGVLVPGPASVAAAAGPSGDVLPALDPVPAGEVAVVASSALNGGKVAAIVQNGTDHPVTRVRVRGTATSPDGGVVASSRRVAVIPGTLAPGSYGLARLDFRRDGAPIGSEIRYRVMSARAASGTDPHGLDVGPITRSAPMTGAIAQTLTFPVTNAAKRVAKGPITARVMCFNEARTPVNVTTAKVRKGGLAAGQTVTATVRLAQLCPTALVAARSA